MKKPDTSWKPAFCGEIINYIFNGAVIKLGICKVAIIGAGISGLACALELKRNGITPVVFEKTGNIGGELNYFVSVLRIFGKLQSNPMKYLKSKYKLDLKPINKLDEILMIGPTRSVTIRGKLGFVFSKGRDEYSIESQLADSADIDISFDNLIKVSDIEKDFDHIVVATGNFTIPNELGLWNMTFEAYTRSAEILGEFNPRQIIMWLNRQYFNNGYGYLKAKSTRSADLVLSVTDSTSRELDHYWREFLRGENINNTIVSTSDTQQFIGCTIPVKSGKLYFVGNVGGMIDNFLGIGAIRSIESGILAARSIAGKGDFNKMMKPLLSDVGIMREYRSVLNRLRNDDLDRLLGFIGLPFVKQAIYNNPFYRINQTVLLPKLFNKIADRNK